MPKEIYKILGQQRPAVSTETVLYTSPVKRSSIVKVTIFNNDSVAALISVAMVPDGGGVGAPATVAKHYIIEDFSLAAKTPYSFDNLKGLTMSEYDQIRVESDSDKVSFHTYGVELEP